jgi:hypothetical protein
VLPRQLRYGGCQDKLGRGLGPPFVLYHDREFLTTPLSLHIRAYVLKKYYVGDLGVVLSWSKRKSNYERVREYRGGNSEWRGTGRVRGPGFFACHLFSSLPSACYSFTSRIIIHARRPAPGAPCIGLPVPMTL